MSLQVTYESNVSVLETFTGDYVSSGNNSALFNGLNENGDSYILTSSTDVPVTKHSEFQQALSSGTATIDLTALPGLTDDETVDGTGLKVQIAKFRNLASNANAITITFGASNPYNLLGSAFVMELLPGQSITLYLDEAAPDIASGAKNLDISGTGAQILECQFVMG